MQNYVKSFTTVPHELINLSSYVYTWPDVVTLINNTPALDRTADALETKRLINVHSANPASSLRRAYGGRLWNWLAKDVFPLMRKSTVTVYFDGSPQELTGEPQKQGVYIEDFTWEADTIVEEIPVAPDTFTEEQWMRHTYLKTNLPAWLCLWINAAFEVDIAPHWTFNLPIYYSGFNYFIHTLKFRTFAVQPEFRWFPNKHNRGFFAGVHAGLVYYDVALKGEIRYQDYNGTTPALGGGIAIGYRFRINSNPRIFMEATVGGGVYKLHYDKFLNCYNGMKVGEQKRTFYGIDQVAFSFVYRFGGPGKNKEKGGNL